MLPVSNDWEAVVSHKGKSHHAISDLTLISQPSPVAQWSEHLLRKWKVPGLNPGRANNFPLNGGNCSHGSKNHLDDGFESLTAESHLEDFALSDR